MMQALSTKIVLEPNSWRQVIFSSVLFAVPILVVATDQLIVGPESDLLVDEIYSDSLGWRDTVDQEYLWRKPAEPEKKSRISWGYDASYDAVNTGRFDPHQRGPDVLDETKPATLFRSNF
mgnify:FL=1